MRTEIKNSFKGLEINTERLLIRHIENKDRNDFFEIFSNEETAINDGIRPYVEMDKRYEADFKYISDQMHFAIELKEGNKMIGIMHLTEILERAVECYEIGYDIHYAFRRKGYATEAINAIIEYCFNFLGIEMLVALVNEWNEESISLLNKLGFLQEGKIHKAQKHYKFGVVDQLSFYKER
ncbi:GNAT family N-acetyltransferase [Inconstantimicrobium mannanitabidum]|uniref:N-acetyltransferase n=1 Tax=Inconstantimicrobium mannanitabidum TaxID=1604901 RepID=A0ACB5R8I7_9CLOT|nr:GNAT family N-acetyltransferase [Clostridium sp. TW13]GKX65345.1 N-acetyltransferase [Clostridium sp. TW13]